MNSINTYIMTTGYESMGNSTENLVRFIGKTCKNFSNKTTLYLIDFPSGYVSFYKMTLKPFIDINYGGDIKILWVDNQELKNIYSKNSNSDMVFFIKFQGKKIYNVTNYYKFLLNMKVNKMQRGKKENSFIPQNDE